MIIFKPVILYLCENNPHFIFIALSLFFISGCGKDSDPGSAKTKTELIAQGPWKLQSASSSLLPGDISTNPLLACYADNVITFAANLSGTIAEGTAICSPAAPGTFNWAFQSSETVLHLSFTLFTGGSPDFTIVSLNENQSCALTTGNHIALSCTDDTGNI
ncbi:MAG: hypothetical protein WDO16_19130 [Bacteroidota bacterium]